MRAIIHRLCWYNSRSPMPPYALTPRNIQIRDNFDAIAPRYDLTNRVISLGIDLHWRRVAARPLGGAPAGGRGAHPARRDRRHEVPGPLGAGGGRGGGGRPAPR